MPIFEYEIRPTSDGLVERGEIEAVDEANARRKLRVLYCTPSLPKGTRLIDTERREADERQAQSAKMRKLLRVLNVHHQWLLDPAQGERAELRGLDLSKVSLRGGQLSQAVLTHVDLSGADLVGADLSQADLSGAILVGADLTGADLSHADLSDADLRDSLLAGARLDGARCVARQLPGVFDLARGPSPRPGVPGAVDPARESHGSPDFDHFGNVVPEHVLDARLERHRRTGAAGARALQVQVDDTVFIALEDDVAPRPWPPPDEHGCRAVP